MFVDDERDICNKRAISGIGFFFLGVQKGFSHCVLDEREMGSNSWMMSEMGFCFKCVHLIIEDENVHDLFFI